MLVKRNSIKKFTEFLMQQASSKTLFNYFLLHRIGNLVALLLVNSSIYHYMNIGNMHQFNCHVKYPVFSETTETIYSDPETGDLYTLEMIVCSINGVAIRQMVSIVLFLFFSIMFIYGIIGTFIEARSIKKSTRLLRMCDQVFDVDEILKKSNGSALTDLALLMNLASSSLRSSSLTVKMCISAWEISGVVQKSFGGEVADQEKRNAFLTYLSSRIAIEIPEKNDDLVAKVVGEATQE